MTGGSGEKEPLTPRLLPADSRGPIAPSEFVLVDKEGMGKG